ncbi:uncharacterized protein C5orf34 homolog isoform X2 [Psammomys obesus]|uniref:uncharacterized protein C5orf34 homolog isoform X2 n=1 Tax=Psammomys obesus TaxID=48139 RepID=UPI0024531B2A|nr:uncharacterized protein C5orf34 homolog isoform X2 [Psammomys obesus]
MAAEVRMVLYEDDSVHVRYADGSKLQLSPCGSEFLFEKAPPLSTHPLEQPERIRQRTHFVISTYREQVQRALDFRNSSAMCPFLSESIIPSERKKHILIDFSEIKWPSLDSDDSATYSESGTVKITSLDGHAYLCLPRSQHEFTRLSDEEEYSYPELVKVVWYKGVTYRLTHKNVNSIEIYPGDGSVFKSEGAYYGNYFTYYSSQEESEKSERKTYSVNNLPPDRPGNLFSVCSLIKQATRILQHCAKTRLSLSHNYRICCWKMVPGVNVSNILPKLLKESLIPNVGRFLAYSDDKVHAVFLDGITLTLNWDFSSSAEKRRVDQGLSLGWCRLTFPDGQEQLIQAKHPGAYERYVTSVISWCRRLSQTSPKQVATLLPPVLQENWSIASELEKIQKFNWLLENSGILNPTSSKKNEQCSEDKSESSETLIEAINEESVSVALKRTSEILQDIEYLLSNSRK